MFLMKKPSFKGLTPKSATEQIVKSLGKLENNIPLEKKIGEYRCGKVENVYSSGEGLFRLNITSFEQYSAIVLNYSFLNFETLGDIKTASYDTTDEFRNIGKDFYKPILELASSKGRLTRITIFPFKVEGTKIIPNGKATEFHSLEKGITHLMKYQSEALVEQTLEMLTNIENHLLYGKELCLEND